MLQLVEGSSTLHWRLILHTFSSGLWWVCSFSSVLMWTTGLEADSKRVLSVAGISVSFPEMDEEEGKTSKRKTGVKETCAFHSGLCVHFPQVIGLAAAGVSPISRSCTYGSVGTRMDCRCSGGVRLSPRVCFLVSLCGAASACIQYRWNLRSPVVVCVRIRWDPGECGFSRVPFPEVLLC